MTGDVSDSPQVRAALIAAQLATMPAGTQVTILGMTATGSTSRRLGQGETDHRQLTRAGSRARLMIRSPSSTAAAIRNAFTTGSANVGRALSARLGRPVGAVAGAMRTMATRIRNALTPTSLGGSTAAAASCFAGSELVTTEQGEKAISEVQVGDRVLTVNAKGEQVFSDVVYLPHGQNAAQTTFVTIATESGRDLKMTSNHILPAGACGASTLPMVAAGKLAAGDCVQTVSGREQVVSVGKVEARGIYTAIAMEELLVVNGIVATPYGGVNPMIANIYYNLHRLVYALGAGSMAGYKAVVQGSSEGVWGLLTALSA